METVINQRTAKQMATCDHCGADADIAAVFRSSYFVGGSGYVFRVYCSDLLACARRAEIADEQRAVPA